VGDQAEPLAGELGHLARSDAVEPGPHRRVLGARRRRRIGERAHDGVGDRRPRLADEVVLARGVHAIGQQHEEELAVGIDPDRRAGEAGVAEGVGREQRARGRAAH